MRELFFGERELLLMPNVPLDRAPEVRPTDDQVKFAHTLVEFKRARWVWTKNPGGVEYLLLDDTEWTQKALRVYELVKDLTR